LTLQKQITDEENRKRVGQTVEVLVEGPARQPGFLMGKTRDNRTVVFEGSPELIGELVTVRITDGSVAGLGGNLSPGPSPIRGGEPHALTRSLSVYGEGQGEVGVSLGL
jgi:hypothetical protein